MPHLFDFKCSRDAFLKPSVLSLILANLYPVAGVLLLGWDTFPILMLFWAENLVIGFYNVIKMALAAGGNVSLVEKIFLIPFFCVHYGTFTLVHGIFVFLLFGRVAEGWDGSVGTLPFGSSLVGIGWGVLALLASHGVSLLTNYIQAGEYREADPRLVMMQPYGRVVVLHLTIIASGFLLVLLGSPAVGLVILIALKTVLDVRSHLNEHAKLLKGPEAISQCPDT